MTDLALMFLDRALRLIIAILVVALTIVLIRGPRPFPTLPQTPDPLEGEREQ